MTNKTLAVDFDLVLCDMNNVPPGQKMGPPMPGAKEAMTELMAAGYTLIIHSVRGQTSAGAGAMVAWLKYFGIPYSSVWSMLGKPNATYYLDDKGIRFYSWEQVLKDIGVSPV